MKFVRFGNRDQERLGILDEGKNIRDLSAKFATPSLENINLINRININDLPVVNDPNLRLGSCVAGIGKIICIGLNYFDHAQETGAKIPSEPMIFMKATSAVCGVSDPIIIPRGSKKTDWEVELAVVIGKKAKHVSEDDALDHVLGYCIANDISERDFQKHRQGQWTKGKSCDNFAPLGPWLVTADEIKDPQQLKLSSKLNGEIMQDASTSKMIYGVSFLISYLSQFMTLHPFDIISTGTPAGVGAGRKPPQFLQVGDRLELSIENLGTQSQTVVAED